MTFLRKNRIGLTLALVGIVFIAMGVWRDETATVLRKAVNICMECIGLG